MVLKPPPHMYLIDAARMARQLRGELIVIRGAAFVRCELPEHAINRARLRLVDGERPTPPEAA